MLDRWTALINSGRPEIDAEREITATAGIIIAKTSFGMSYHSGQEVFKKLRALQETLFNSNRFVGVPFNKILCPKQNLQAKMLGREIDRLLLTIITDRKNSIDEPRTPSQEDLLGFLLQGSRSTVDGNLGKSITSQEPVDECKTFFFGDMRRQQ